MKENRAETILRHNHLNKAVVLSTVSGIVTTEPEMVSFFDKNVTNVDMITTKSYQVVQTFGHREPVVCSIEEGSFGNFVGLRNPGMEAVFPQLKALKDNGMRAILNVSLSANRPEDFITLVRRFDEIADLIELNFSCPHAFAGFGAAIGSDPKIASDYVRQIIQAVPERNALLIIKLTPNVKNIGEIAKAVVDAGADGVAAINTVGPFQYIDPVSGSSIFNTWEGGKGGLSGEAVKARAVECIKDIRAALGDDPIVLGMGGVSCAEDARALIDAGADSVGVGSALARLEMKDYNAFFGCLKSGESTEGLLIKGNRMEYTAHTVLETKVYDDCLLLRLSGEMNCKPGQFAFLWIPDKGEKPFSVAQNDPLTFLIKKRGQFTESCFDLKVGDTVFTRGLYGKPMNITKSQKALLIAGGSGVAVLPLIAEQIALLGVGMKILVGTVKSSDVYPLQDVLSSYGPTSFVPDDGKPGRVLDSISSSDIDGDVRVYIVGPGKMMESAAKRLVTLGMDSQRINMSMERLTLCGIGMCGECACAGKLACKEGTFYKYSELEQYGVKL